MTPYELQIIMNAYVSASQPFDGCDAAIYHEVMGHLIRDGLFEPINSTPALYSPTQKLRAYAELICKIPLPVQQWIIPGLEFLNDEEESAKGYGPLQPSTMRVNPK